MLSDEQEQESSPLIPTEQQTILFYGKPIIVVRLPDGRPGVVLRYLCDNLQITTTGQVARIKRTEVIADDLVYTQVQTEGGPQTMPTLVLHAVPFWLAGIDPKRVREEIRPEILRYQREVVDVLYAWAQSPKAIPASAGLVPAEQITKPTAPADDADMDAWRAYYQQMILWIDWQRDIEQWRGSVESRLEGLEEVTNLIPEILERLGPQTLTSEHQQTIRDYARQLHEQTGKPYPTIWENLKTAFRVAKYADIPELDWPRAVKWFQAQLDQRRK
ncbi:MAG: phage antirepressor N-terminal domain-containing protein [Ktedonobacteraceae bacterium]